MTAETDRLIDCMARMKGENRPFAVATVVRTQDATSAKAGAKAVLRADGTIEGWIGGGCTQGAVRKAAAAARIGFAVTVAALPGDLAAFTQADKRIEGFDLARDSRAAGGFVVVATQGKRDREALAAALATRAPYVGFVGSRKKAAAF